MCRYRPASWPMQRALLTLVTRTATAGEHISEVATTHVPEEVIKSFDEPRDSLAKTPGYDAETAAQSVRSVTDDEKFPAPTEEEWKTLRKVPGNFPASAFILCWVEFAERASYYGVQTVFSNFMQFPLPKGTVPTQPPILSVRLLTDLKMETARVRLPRAPKRLQVPWAKACSSPRPSPSSSPSWPMSSPSSVRGLPMPNSAGTKPS